MRGLVVLVVVEELWTGRGWVLLAIQHPGAGHQHKKSHSPVTAHRNHHLQRACSRQWQMVHAYLAKQVLLAQTGYFTCKKRVFTSSKPLRSIFSNFDECLFVCGVQKFSIHI